MENFYLEYENSQDLLETLEIHFLSGFTPGGAKARLDQIIVWSTHTLKGNQQGISHS